jgi:hypothetical protein
MPDDHESPVMMTNLELRDAIERTPPRTEAWHALIQEACKRTSYPRSWLPPGATGRTS